MLLIKTSKALFKKGALRMIKKETDISIIKTKYKDSGKQLEAEIYHDLQKVILWTTANLNVPDHDDIYAFDLKWFMILLNYGFLH